MKGSYPSVLLREKMLETILHFPACSAQLRVLKRFGRVETVRVVEVVFQDSGHVSVDDFEGFWVGD